MIKVSTSTTRFPDEPYGEYETWPQAVATVADTLRREVEDTDWSGYSVEEPQSRLNLADELEKFDPDATSGSTHEFVVGINSNSRESVTWRFEVIEDAGNMLTSDGLGAS